MTRTRTNTTKIATAVAPSPRAADLIVRRRIMLLEAAEQGLASPIAAAGVRALDALRRADPELAREVLDAPPARVFAGTVSAVLDAAPVIGSACVRELLGSTGRVAELLAQADRAAARGELPEAQAHALRATLLGDLPPRCLTPAAVSERTTAELEADALCAVEVLGWSHAEAARVLGIERRTFRDVLDRARGRRAEEATNAAADDDVR